MKTTLVRVGAWCWLLAPIQFLVLQIIAAAAWAHPYNWFDNYISDLGNTVCGPIKLTGATSTYICSPLHGVMNTAFILAGVLTILGTVLLWRGRYWTRRVLVAVALCLLVANGLGKVLVGFAPENVNLALHGVGALNIPIGSIAAVLLGLAMLRTDRAAGIFSLVVGVVGFVAFVLFGGGQYLGLGAGGMERLAEYPAEIWLGVIGVLAIVGRPKPVPAASDLTSATERSGD
ncbi:DUF998 domain-containing protein [Fodinicola feengrottensis]|uniref:DUF998 domain-containing protein n=1 Tax=Fodinicola feengrottensis TaxID=435914 RepID=A0ABN2G1Q2_9ACTN